MSAEASHRVSRQASQRTSHRMGSVWRFLRFALPGLVFIAAWVALLQVAASRGWINPAFSPVPARIATHLTELAGTGAFLQPTLVTLALLAAGYVSACATGILLGLLMGHSRAVFALFEPLVELVRPIPKAALVPPLILLLGLGPSMKVAIVFLGALFPVLINTVQAVRSLDPVLLATARTFRTGPARLLFAVVLPASLPMIFAGMRISLGLGLVLIILAEMLTSANGLGATIVDLQRSFRVQEMYAWTVVLAVVGLVLAVAFDWIEKRFVFWNSRR